MMRHYQLLKTLLLVGVLYGGVAWSLREQLDPSRFAVLLVAVPVLVAIYAYSKVLEAMEFRAKGIEVQVSLDEPTPIDAHPYMKAASEAANKRRAELKAAGGSGEFDRLMSSAIGTEFRFIYHGGLVWSERDKTFVQKAYVAGRLFGGMLGETESAEADVEPSLVIVEHHGVLSVLLVPVESKEHGSVRRTLSEIRAAERAEREVMHRIRNRKSKKKPAPLPMEEDDDAPNPPPFTLGQFPVRAFRDLLAMPEEGAGSWGRWNKAMDALEKEYGLTTPKRERDDYDPSDWFETESKYVRFSFRQTG